MRRVAGIVSLVAGIIWMVIVVRVGALLWMDDPFSEFFYEFFWGGILLFVLALFIGSALAVLGVVLLRRADDRRKGDDPVRCN